MPTWPAGWATPGATRSVFSVALGHKWDITLSEEFAPDHAGIAVIECDRASRSGTPRIGPKEFRNAAGSRCRASLVEAR